MVQSIAGISSNSVVSSINGATKLDDNRIKEAFGLALGEASIAEGVSGQPPAPKEDLIEEFKNVTKGITVCKTCGAIYHGTAVAECSKCGNKVNEDHKKTSDTQGVEQSSGIDSAKVASSASADGATTKAPTSVAATSEMTGTALQK